MRISRRRKEGRARREAAQAPPAVQADTAADPEAHVPPAGGTQRRYERDPGVPLIFSVTGHTDIPNEQYAAVGEKVKELFAEYHEKYPNTKMILLTALAEGADRIAADAALRSNVTVMPVLPTSLEKYKETFTGRAFGSKEGSLADFERILSDPLAYSPISLSEIDLNVSSEGYRYLSAYLIANSHVMIALWDGRKYTNAERSKGGTYDTVRMACNGVDDDLRHMTHPVAVAENKKTFSPETHLRVTEDCLIYHIQVSRLISDEDLKRKGCVDTRYPFEHLSSRYIVPEMMIYELEDDEINEGGDTEKNDAGVCRGLPEYYHKMFTRMNVMNDDIGYDPGYKLRNGSIAEDLCRCRDSRGSDHPKIYDYIIGNEAAEIRDNDLMYDMVMRQTAADRLASQYQKKSFKNIKISIVLSLIAATFLQFYILFGAAALLVMIYAAVLIVSQLFYRSHKDREVYSKFIEYRLIAESMRVGCYWGMAGVNESTTSEVFGYMKNDMSWAGAILTAWESYVLNDFDKLKEGREERMDIAGPMWVEGQKSYHKKKKEKNAKIGAKNDKKLFYLQYALVAGSVAAFVFSAVALGYEALAVIEEIAAIGLIMIGELEITPLNLAQIFLILVSLYMMLIVARSEKLMHGGKDIHMDAKFRMFDIAEKRLKIAERVYRHDKEMCADVKSHIYYELGVQCINEANDWAFEHMDKDADEPDLSLPGGG